MESSRRDLSNDMAKHGPILKDHQNMYYPRFSFTQNRYSIPQKGVWFLLSNNVTFENYKSVSS